MVENKTEVTIGALVLSIAVMFGVYLWQFSGSNFGGSYYPLSAGFRSAEGLAVGTDVRLAGVKIGSISQLMLDTEKYEARAVFAINEDILIPDDSAVIIASEGLLGGTFVEVIPGGSFDYLQENDEFLETQGAVSLVSLLMKFVTGGDDQ